MKTSRAIWLLLFAVAAVTSIDARVTPLAIQQNSQNPNDNRPDGFPKIARTDTLVAALDSVARAHADLDLFSGTVLVAHDGEVLYEKAFGFANLEWKIPNGPETVFDLASLSKQFTAAAVLILYDRGRLDLDAFVGSYVPALDSEVFKKLTVRQLLTHTSGLPDEPLPPATISNLQFMTRKGLVAALNKLEPVYEPGAHFSYSNSGYNVLALVIESLSGMKFGDFLKKEIFQPLGMTATAFRERNEVFEHGAEGYGKLRGQKVVEHWANADIQAMGCGNVYSTVRDLMKWDRALYDHKVISKKSTDLMFTRALNNYGFGWDLPTNLFINRQPQVVAMHSGRGPGTSTIIQRFTEQKLLVVVLSNVQNSNVEALAADLCGTIGGVEMPAPRPSFEDELQNVLFSQGVEAAAQAHRAAAKEKKYTMPGSGQLNRLAYQFLRAGRVEESLKVFELYLALYPKNSFAHDGYAEALFLNNETERSIEYYKKALELNPQNAAAIRMLKYLTSGSNHLNQ